MGISQNQLRRERCNSFKAVDMVLLEKLHHVGTAVLSSRMPTLAQFAVFAGLQMEGTWPAQVLMPQSLSGNCKEDFGSRLLC
mmetsp:Transcript_7476/g.19931  ORF Transcript_7476/g.19931 Transcript_7476/m.19931 type:complete len:82 (+) Transcript_7476:181-426(+)